jgi:lipase
MRAYETFTVPVNGGDLTVGRWGRPDAPVVVAVHGITGNHLSWADTAAALGDDVALVAPDLRGRGGSGRLPGPYGMAAHAADVIAVLDHLDVDRAPLVGHSMGGFVVSVTTATYPDRVSKVVLVDGGPALPVPAVLDIDQTLEAVIGPAMARLSMTFASRDAYRDFWRAHPAFASGLSPSVEAYVDYDLIGDEPELRSKVSADAVRADAADTLTNAVIPAAVASLPDKTPWLRAERGMLDQPVGLYPDEVAGALLEQHPNLVDVLVPDVNHYTITLGERGAAVVADHIRAAL